MMTITSEQVQRMLETLYPGCQVQCAQPIAFVDQVLIPRIVLGTPVFWDDGKGEIPVEPISQLKQERVELNAWMVSGLPGLPKFSIRIGYGEKSRTVVWSTLKVCTE